MLRAAVVGLGLATAVLAKEAPGAPYEDLIRYLPELDWNTNYNQWSGYLDLENGHHLHYWFVESQHNPDTDPVILWLNGGPGCSSLDGLLYEHGPFMLNHTGGLHENPYAWNTLANVIYLESPIGVGFSYADDGDYRMSDNTTADDAYHALVQWFGKFPNFNGRDFYITGESYAGVYVPSLTLRILEAKRDGERVPFNLKAFAVGNGIFGYENNDDSSVWYTYYHGMIDTPLWENLLKQCCTQPYTQKNCQFSMNENPACQRSFDKVMHVIYESGLNWYNVYGDCINAVGGFSHEKYMRDMENMFSAYHQRTDGKLLKNLKMNVPCIDTTGANMYLNRYDVKKALHIPSTPKMSWQICSEKLIYERQWMDMSPVYNEIFNMDSEIWALVFNGDTDLACNFLGNEWFLDDFVVWNGQSQVTPYRTWNLDYDEQVCGWTKDYERISFTTIKGAGHMVPQYKPREALKMLEYFVDHKYL